MVLFFFFHCVNELNKIQIENISEKLNINEKKNNEKEQPKDIHNIQIDIEENPTNDHSYNALSPIDHVMDEKQLNQNDDYHNEQNILDHENNNHKYIDLKNALLSMQNDNDTS